MCKSLNVTMHISLLVQNKTMKPFPIKRRQTWRKKRSVQSSYFLSVLSIIGIIATNPTDEIAAKAEQRQQDQKIKSSTKTLEATLSTTTATISNAT